MHRFFVGAGEIVQGEVHFSAEVSRQITRVLRLHPGKEVQALDNLGNEYLVSVKVVSDGVCTGEILEKKVCSSETRVRLTMLLSLTQREKFEWMLQKCTEVGAACFQPVLTSRSLVQHVEDLQGKYPRWEKIIREAAEQSGRGLLPRLLEPLALEPALSSAAQSHDLCVIPWEEEKGTSLKQVLSVGEFNSVAVLIGPEGGFSQSEVYKARELGFVPVSLGKRILRMETAAIVAAALVLHELD